MNHTNIQNAQIALKITTLLTIIVAGYEVLCSYQNYQTGMNLLDIASYANANLNMYCLVLILANLILLPIIAIARNIKIVHWIIHVLKKIVTMES